MPQITLQPAWTIRSGAAGSRLRADAGFRASINALPGYDAPAAGTVMPWNHMPLLDPKLDPKRP